MKSWAQYLKLLLLIPVLAVIVLALNPTEVANKKRDEMYLATARHFQDSAQKYFALKRTTTSYGFVTADKLGFEALALNPNDKFIADNLSSFYIGRQSGPTSPVYVCYVPLAKFNRDAACNDGNVYTLDSSDGQRQAVECGLSADWQTGENPWVICLPN